MKYSPLGKRGQMEMVGLVIIVILITLGMLFMIQFALKDNPGKKIFTRKGLAYSTMSTLMKTSVECKQPNGLTTYPIIGKDLIDDCARVGDGPASFCTYQCGNKHCCSVLHDVVDDRLNQTLGVWNKRYEFRSTSTLLEQEIIDPILVKGGCQGRERDSSGLFPIFAGAGGLVENELYLCD